MRLQLQNICVKFPDHSINADLVIESIFTGISGPSGSGKTTLLECITGMRSPDSGRILLNGRVLVDADQNIFLPSARRGIGYVPQDGLLFPHLSVQNNIRFGNRRSPDISTDFLEHVSNALEITPLLNRSIKMLSGGEKQRVNVARALVSHPSLLLFDEPMSSVDSSLKEKMLSLLLRVRDEFKIPTIYVSHDESELKRLCDSVLSLNNGVLYEQALSPSWNNAK